MHHEQYLILWFSWHIFAIVARLCAVFCISSYYHHQQELTASLRLQNCIATDNEFIYFTVKSSFKIFFFDWITAEINNEKKIKAVDRPQTDDHRDRVSIYLFTCARWDISIQTRRREEEKKCRERSSANLFYQEDECIFFCLVANYITVCDQQPPSRRSTLISPIIELVRSLTKNLCV